MDAFRSVDATASKTVYKVDTQKDWQEWREDRGKSAYTGKNSGVYGSTRHTPQFPKLGGFNAGSADQSNLHVGLHDKVHAPDTVRDKKRKSDQVEEVVTVKDVPGEGKWTELVKPDTGETYYFNQVTGESTDKRPDLFAIQYAEVDFEPCESFDGARVGFVFKKGSQGTGYYRDVGLVLSDEQDPVKQQKFKRKKKRKKKNVETPNPFEQVQAAIAKHRSGQQTKPVESRADSTGAVNVSKTVVPDIWEEVHDPLTRRTYYANRATNQTTWERPASLKKSVDDFQRAVDPKTRKIYYYNRKTGETRW
eukprot:CAMPEP_0203770746 /NCGR_PEP_ID=MMETSP0099_2-20121227/3014_1 /ASSEMBLY_ACC=CAM_ASM_000209 /TAXON_ID=96639 /ORGANISM=" , Strain NY0313808BC1" /LENGTH=306 /DNA_ID=CAMNT_0050667981 /DNA_START=564 /DNA_END=1481 /DNA_ORIENTATION=+